jgi:acetyl-CoA synthetase
MRAGDGPVRAHDRSTLQVIAVTGEPLNPSAARWLSQVVGEGRLPTMNISGGTEIGVVILAPYPVEPIAEASVGGPCLGMGADVVDAAGQPVRGSVGELVIRGSWPGMTRGVWRDPERYLATYWSTFPGLWRHGDWARIDETGWSVLGRADETLNIAGKRIGASEIESVLVADPDVREAAAVGIHDDLKGEVPWCFCVLVDDAARDEADLADVVADALGKPFRPARVVVVDDLPRTRSGKLLRRGLAAIVRGDHPGDLATIEDPAVLDAIGRRLGAT